ncbi:MAG TPA: phosphoribosylamine--glycine ligase [Candidatus Gastranaerophilales bacterium]|nr:phosphoribosylamine--glycine ligase [Candidatus Gastranaerophilales bacterium]
MKVFIIGSGAKIHSLIWKLAQSKRVSKIYSSYTNAGISKLAEFVDIRENENNKLYEFVKENNIDLTVLDSLTTGVTGLADKLRAEGFNVFGPGENSCKIAMSCSFLKKFMHKYKIPTPHFGVFDKESMALAYARKAQYPQVVKFDSRIPGTGSIVCESFNEAKNAISFCLKNLYKPVVLEDYIPGKEISFQVIMDGYDAVPLPAAYVYKKSQNGNLGFNTDGMGAYSPVSFVDQDLEGKIAQRIFFPIIDGLNAEKMGFAGLLKATIILDEKNNPNLVKLNVVFGDPETQTVMPILNEDIFDIITLSSVGALADSYESFKIAEEHSVCVSFVSEGYPNEYKKGFVIEGLDEIVDDNTFVFHGGTEKNVYAEVVTKAGRVLDIVSTGSTLNRAQKLVYESVDLIEFQNMKYRKDIAKVVLY